MAKEAKLITKKNKGSSNFDKSEVESGKAMSILSYIGILCLIPYFAEKKNRFVRLHAVAGLNLLIAEIIWAVVTSILTTSFAPTAIYSVLSGSAMGLGGIALIQTIAWIGNICFFALSIIGIVNAVNGEYKDLPVIGGFKFVKK